MTRFGFLLFALCLSAPVHAQEKLSTENAMAIQEALVWTGDYSGPLDGSLGGATMKALKSFQAREGRPAKGRIGSGDAKRLAKLSKAAKREAGWSLTPDGANNVMLWLPRAVLPAASRTADGRVFASADGTIRLGVFTSKADIAAIYASARRKPGREIEQEVFEKGRSIVTGREGDNGFFDFAAAGAKGAKGFRLSYPLNEAARLRPMAVAIANGFITEPGAQLGKTGTRAVPNFVGAFRFDDPVRPYAYGAIDVETRETTITGGSVAVHLIATDPPPPPGTKPQKRKRRLEFDAPFVPKLTIFVEGAPVLELADPAWVTHFSDVRLVELDPANSFQEVLFTNFTGGAHCCTELTIFSARADGSWARIAGGSFDGAPNFPQDLDGDGRFELVNTDNRFIGTFDCYACSYAPDQIRRLDGETLSDVSADTRFLPDNRNRLGEIWNRGWQSGAIPSEGFLAGFSAAARRTGDGEDASAFLKTVYTPKKGAQGSAFPDRLKSFLDAEKY
jgi:hypothetical protein